MSACEDLQCCVVIVVLSVHLFICPSVTFRYCVKVARHYQNSFTACYAVILVFIKLDILFSSDRVVFNWGY